MLQKAQEIVVPLMHSLQEAEKPVSTTEEKPDKEVPCKNKCGGLVEAFWHAETDKWCYRTSGFCSECLTKEHREQQRRQWASASGITPEETLLTLESFRETEGTRDALSACKRMALGDGINLVLSGAAGRGKTHLAIGVLNAKQHKRVLFLPVTRWLMTVRGAMKTSGEDYWIDRFMNLDAVVLDDFGSNKLTDWSLSFMDCLIDEWYRRRKKGLIVTSNFSLKQIAENISDRMASRLSQISEIYELGGKDFRIGKK